MNGWILIIKENDNSSPAFSPPDCILSTSWIKLFSTFSNISLTFLWNTKALAARRSCSSISELKWVTCSFSAWIPVNTQKENSGRKGRKKGGIEGRRNGRKRRRVKAPRCAAFMFVTFDGYVEGRGVEWKEGVEGRGEQSSGRKRGVGGGEELKEEKSEKKRGVEWREWKGRCGRTKVPLICVPHSFFPFAPHLYKLGGH